jgi:hypothetical protein
MSTRKIIDPKQNGEKVWLKGHAQAIYMSDGSTVEDAINSIEIPSLDEYVTETELNDKGFLTEHQDISHLASKEWVNNNNYATEYDLSNIDYSSIKNVPVSEDETGELNITDESGNIGMKVASEAVYAKDFVAGEHKLSNKQDAITDLETIRQGAAKGATALQSYTEQYKGTVTGVKINGITNNPSSGVVDLGYINKQLSTSTSSSMTLSPNIYYRNTSTSLSSLTITLGSVSNSNIINEYFVEFTTRSAGTTVSLPSTIKWANGEAPTFEASTTYQISIVNNLGVVTKFK